MRSTILATVRLLVLLCFAANLSGQSRDAKPPSPTASSITGRVLLDGQPAAGVTVAVSQQRSLGNQNMPVTKSVTDGDGHFRLTNLAAGVYLVAPLAPGFLTAGEVNPFEEGQSVTLDEGETAEDVNFSIKRGGVIMGRVTDENREPIVETRVNLMTVSEQGQAQNLFMRNAFMYTTDDRGVYRIYGLPAGRYKVSVGEHPGSGAVMMGMGNARYHRTFHPDVTDESKAEIIEITDGGEAGNVDISVNSKMKTYMATGRFVHAVTGKPVVNVPYGYGTVSSPSPGQEQYLGGTGLNGNRTNSKGEFRLEGMPPGRYAAVLVRQEGMEFYSEPAVFEVKDRNVSGIEVKVRAGASISGYVSLEGTNNPALAAAFLQLRLGAQISPRALEGGFLSPSKISPDGTFHITGLRAGKAQLFVYSNPNEKKMTLLRIEHNGVEVKDGIEIKDGEQITGVRLAFAYGTAMIRGQVKIENGTLPEGARLSVRARRIGGNMAGNQGMYTYVDGRGRFAIEEMIAGEYELVLMKGFSPLPANRALLNPIKQTVTVTDGAVLQVVFVFDVGEKKDGQ
jgi:hypothetical protein